MELMRNAQLVQHLPRILWRVLRARMALPQLVDGVAVNISHGFSNIVTFLLTIYRYVTDRVTIDHC